MPSCASPNLNLKLLYYEGPEKYSFPFNIISKTPDEKFQADFVSYVKVDVMPSVRLQFLITQIFTGILL